MSELNASELEQFVSTKSLAEFPADSKRMFFLFSKKICTVLIKFKSNSIIMLYINTLCFHLAQTNNPKLALWLADKAISIYNELACLSESSEYLNNNDALSITIEKLLIGRIQWSNNLSHIRRALQMLSIIMTNILTARDDESTINHYCSIIAHSVWKYAESNSVDDFIILIQCLMNTFPSPADYLALIRIAISLNKPVGLIELNKETINSIIEHTPLLKIR